LLLLGAGRRGFPDRWTRRGWPHGRLWRVILRSDSNPAGPAARADGSADSFTESTGEDPLMSEPIYETARLLVRHFRMNDLDAFAALCADPLVMRFVGDGQPLPRSEVERWIGVCQQKYAERGYGTSAVFEKASRRFIGYCGVVRAPGNDYDELIYVYHADTWGRGYATEAARPMIDHVFSRSSLDRIRARRPGPSWCSSSIRLRTSRLTPESGR
jgi:[ribosomal protein S5]-alanine N-acetyltransferase